MLSRAARNCEYNRNNNGASSLIEVTSSSTQHSRFAALSCFNIEDDHLITNRLLCRTPPPTYRSFPATPPPSYTARVLSNEEQQSPLNQHQVPEVLVGLNQEESRRQQEHEYEHVDFEETADVTNFEFHGQRQLVVADGTSVWRNVATVSQQQQQRRRKLRHRRVQLLQQQQQLQRQHSPFNNRHTTTDTENSTSSGNESDSEINSRHRREQRRLCHRQRLSGLKDAYCPDLLNACSLILTTPQPQSTSDSTVDNFAVTPSPLHEVLNETSNYAEIVGINTARRRGGRREAHSSPVFLEGNYLNSSRTQGVPNQRLSQNSGEMGQNLSLRRPRISLTWVLRDQQPQKQQQPQDQIDEQAKEGINDNVIESNKPQNNNQLQTKSKSVNSTNTTQWTDLTCHKKRYRLRQLPSNNEALSGYATTPTIHAVGINLSSQKFFSNQNLLEYHKEEVHTKPPSKDLLFVCTPQHAPDSFGGSSDALALTKKRNEIRKKLATKMANFRSETATPKHIAKNFTKSITTANGGFLLRREPRSSLKANSYSEPSLLAASEGNPRRHRHRKRRERNRSQKFGYDIRNVDEFLRRCSLSTPANIPMVLSTSCTLYQTRPGGYQTELSLPLGMVVNAVFKNENWLYVQTPHAEEGYVSYNCCLPLGILPPEARGEGVGSAKPTPCWESNGDIFPKPCGNMTDSEKELHLRGGGSGTVRSEGARTPHMKALPMDNESVAISVKMNHVDRLNDNLMCDGEHHVDKLYLKAASQPKLNERPAYAQLKVLKTAQIYNKPNPINDEYVTLQQQHQRQAHNPHHHTAHSPTQMHEQQQHHHQQSQFNHVNANSHQHYHRTILNALRRSTAHCGQRHTLVAITTGYTTADGLSLQKGDIVTLCECRETKDHRQWFYVRTRDGRQGYIPAEVAGHGYL
uniref:SH3 domain-containing protein n=1 Tax=Glossina austeni TaxID=7395 RepID=A0A1A9V2U7_GLOAU